MKVTLVGSTFRNNTGPSRVTVGMTNALRKHPDVELKVITYGDDIGLGEYVGTVGDSVVEILKRHRKIDKKTEGIVHALERVSHSDIRTVQWTSSSLTRLIYSRDEFGGFRALLGDFIIGASERLRSNPQIITSQAPSTARETEQILRWEVDEVIPLGVNEEMIYEDHSNGDKVSLVGHVNQLKGQEEILGDLENPHVVGSCSEDIRKEYDATFTGYLDDREIEEHYKNTDIVVIPSLHETFCMVALEAIARGCVVVTTENVGFATFDKVRSCDGVIICDSVNNIPENVSYLKQQNLTDMKKDSIRLAKEMTWKKVANKYVKIYQDL